MFNYAKSAATARRLIANFGQSMTLSKEVYDIDTGLLVSATDTIDKGVILPYKNGVISASGGLIKASDQKVLICINAIPAPTDRLTVGDNIYSIVNVQAIEPAGINVLYIMQVRK